MVAGSFGIDARVRVPIVIDNVGTILAAKTALHIMADEVDAVDEATAAPIRYYLSAEHAAHDAARSPVFSGNGEWEGWIPPVTGGWTIHVRKESDDSSVDDLAVTVS